MSQDQLSSLYFSSLEDQQNRMATTLRRHCGSLTKTTFDGCVIVQSQTIKTILITCSVLRDFSVSGDSLTEHTITLEDAIARRWASTRIRSLCLVFNIGDMEELRKESIYVRPPPIVLSAEEAARMERLEKLYQ
ncbi:hypothetical protein BGX23_001803 [Mortierella sp. AD031]|nr:hypothetical protein BGX23_001803 [Mortierella sp. AD031]